MKARGNIEGRQKKEHTCGTYGIYFAFVIDLSFDIGGIH